MMTTKDHAIDLVSRLSPEDLAGVTPIPERLLARPPLDLDQLQAQWDALPPLDVEEPLSEDDLRAIDESRGRRARGEAGIPHDEIHRRVQGTAATGRGE